ncbi:hypothetical protein P4O66_005397 [Electrophorus voltai]|uniref:Ig-like domain-containing protein n=1 Tax=Electrophorus voltai TaxID=2609070 RepID=A0AAD9E767_9TELE|nr:hypothetical protein P4O66_005397 [Electrophorus voltai]
MFPPEVSVFQKDSSSAVCHATGFFPRGVEISWQKNGEDLHENMDLRETLPNQDGTFQKRSILTVSPEDLKNNKYTCVVQHLGKDIEREVKPGGRSFGVIIGVFVAVLLLVLIGCVGFFIWRKKRNGCIIIQYISFIFQVSNLFYSTPLHPLTPHLRVLKVKHPHTDWKELEANERC